jgi:hypothetical protein
VALLPLNPIGIFEVLIFREGGKTGALAKRPGKNLQSKGENQQQTKRVKKLNSNELNTM